MLSLVAYSSSDEESSPIKPPTEPLAKRPKLVLANTIKHLHFGGSQPTDEDADAGEAGEQQHGGRIRSFAHERGNWATYVYINFPDSNHSIANLQADLQQRLLDACSLDFQPTGQLHLSLTRTVVLKHHWIELFVQSLKERIPQHSRFPIRLAALQAYRNDERTRTFIALALEPADDLQPARRLVTDLDAALHEFRLPAYYADPSFHVSLLWCLGDQLDRIRAELAGLSAVLLAHRAESHDAADVDGADDSFGVRVQSIECKIGNKLYTFPLAG